MSNRQAAISIFKNYCFFFHRAIYYPPLAINNMTQPAWLIDESVLPDQEIENEIKLQSFFKKQKSVEEQPNLAVRIQDLMIWDNKKWFGSADIRLDALVVHGNAVKGNLQSVYSPGTFRFPDIKDGEPAFTGENGLLIFFGQPRYFLDVFILVSRDSKNSQDLSSLLTEEFNSPEIQASLTTLLGLAVAAPSAIAISAAATAAITLGDLAYRFLDQAAGKTIGLYRTSWLEKTNDFGIGRHPEKDSHHVRDFSFFYEITKE